MRACLSYIGLVLLLALPAQAQQRFRMLEHNYSFDELGKVTIETYKGSVKVQTWDREEIQIDVRIEAEDFDGLIMLPEVDIIVGGTVDNVLVETDYRRAIQKLQSLFNDVDSKRLPLVHYSIHVPRTAGVTIDDYMSQIHVAGLASAVEIYTYKGNVAVVGIAGPLTVNTFRGTADIFLDGTLGNSRIGTHEGRIAVHLPQDTGFTFAMRLGDDPRAIFAADPRFQSLANVQRSYDGPINGGGPSLSLSTHSGSLRLGSQ